MNNKHFPEQAHQGHFQNHEHNHEHHHHEYHPNQQHAGQPSEQPAVKQPTESPAQPQSTEVPKPEVAAPSLAEELKQAQNDVAYWKDLALRATAEMENLRKRTQIDIQKATRYANGSFAKELLPVADCLEQALTCAKQELDKEKAAGAPENPILTNLVKGVEMTQNNLTSALKKQQIEKMAGLGQIFDPNLHKVIQEVADPSHPAGTIVQELQPGYTIGGDRVLREAMVIVSK